MTTQTLLNTVKINETDLPIIEFEGERVLPFKLIDSIHGRNDGTARDRFKANRERFIENEDYFVVSAGVFHPLIWESFGFEPKSNKGTLITETGYLLLVKSFTDDLAWEIQRMLVRAYFRTRSAEDKISPKEYRTIRSRISNLVSRIAKVTDGMELKTLWDEVLDLSKIIDRPLPDITLLGTDHKQLTLPLI